MQQARMNARDGELTGLPPSEPSCALPDAALSRRVKEVVEDFSTGLNRVEELANGYALRFPGTAGWIAKLADFIAYERRCCPFFAFELAVEPAGGPVWLRLRGTGVKELLDWVDPLEGAQREVAE
ncbi:MAG: hypothetical protein R3291_00835 [Thermoplasmata archaeon]|nr:hypothetical protein [Thermoplasmata archaeon]